MTASPRPIAGDVGTDNRIDCEAGHYWVRLWSRQAIRREGEAMVNCLREGAFQSHAGSDDPTQNGLWSLRDVSGKSVALALLSGGLPPMNLVSFLGPQNAMASALAYRQLRHLAAYFFDAHTRFVLYESTIKEPVVVAPDGSTYRWDRAPKALRLPDHEARLEARRRAHEEAKRRREAAERLRESQPPIPDGEAGHPHYFGDGLDADQPPFEPITAEDVEIARRYANVFSELGSRPTGRDRIRETVGERIAVEDYVEVRTNELPERPVVARWPTTHSIRIAGAVRQGDEIVVSLTDGRELRLPWQPELEVMQATLDRGVVSAEDVASAYRNDPAFRANLSQAARRDPYGRRL